MCKRELCTCCAPQIMASMVMHIKHHAARREPAMVSTSSMPYRYVEHEDAGVATDAALASVLCKRPQPWIHERQHDEAHSHRCCKLLAGRRAEHVEYEAQLHSSTRMSAWRRISLVRTQHRCVGGMDGVAVGPMGERCVMTAFPVCTNLNFWTNRHGAPPHSLSPCPQNLYKPLQTSGKRNRHPLQITCLSASCEPPNFSPLGARPRFC